MPHRWSCRYFSAMCLAAFLCGPPAHAQIYPTRAVRIIVPSAPGAATDAHARMLAQQLSTLWRVQVVVDNRPSHDGHIAAETAVKAKPDGHTLLLTTNALALNQALHSKLPYDAARDFVAVGAIASAPFVLLVHPTLRVTSVKDLIDTAKAQPEKLTHSHSGTGSADHLCGELFKHRAGIRALPMPYKAEPRNVPAPHAEGQYLFAPVTAAVPLLKGGQARAIAVTSMKRSERLPDIPAIGESLPGFECSAWQALFAPTRAPQEALRQLQISVARAMQNTEIAEHLAAHGLNAVRAGPEELRTFLAREVAMSIKLVREANVRLD